MTTPKKPAGVRWELDIDMSPFDSPSSTSNTSFASTSTLQYLNLQLVSHGFISSPELCLDGLSSKDMEKTVKCMLSLLSQRMQDMGRAEELTTRFRTLSYDHERLVSMHRAANEKVSCAEKELTLHKSRLAASERTIQTMITSLRKERHELQRTRTSLQGVRQSYVAEVKRKEKEIERMLEKWGRISEAQSKVTSAPSGYAVKGANATVVEGLVMKVGGSDGYLEVALEDAENSRRRLAADNMQLRELALNAVNSLQTSLSLAKKLTSLAESNPIEEEPLYTLATLFPLGPPGFAFARETLSSLLSSLDAAIELLSQRAHLSTKSPIVENGSSQSNAKEAKIEIATLQETIDTLKGELAQAHDANTREIQTLFDQFTADPGRVPVYAANADVSMELMTAPKLDLERERLDALRKELTLEREKFTEATVRLGKERARLEAERTKLREEKRQMQVDMMLADLPPTPAAMDTLSPSGRSKTRPKAASPRRSPPSALKKPAGGKTRITRRSSFGLPSMGKNAIEPSYETEVIPPGSLLEPPSFHELLSTKFVLPPPSPFSSLPIQPVAVSLSLGPVPTIPEENSSASSPSPPIPESNSLEPNDIPPPTSPAPTPRRSFPIAKPHAQHMIHAYSPVKPSPLSRILMLVDSPAGEVTAGGALGGLNVISEDAEEDMFPVIQPPNLKPSLAAELGLKENDDESSPPQAEKKANTARNSDAALSRRSQGRGPIKAKVHPRQSMARERAKVRAGPESLRPASREFGQEKENGANSTTGLLKSRGASKVPSMSVKGSASRRAPANSGGAGWRSVPHLEEA